MIVDNIRKLVDQQLNVDSRNKRRYKDVVDAKIIITILSLNIGVSKEVLSKYFKKNKTTIVHYKKSFENFMITDKDFAMNYKACLEKFQELIVPKYQNLLDEKSKLLQLLKSINTELGI